LRWANPQLTPQPLRDAVTFGKLGAFPVIAEEDAVGQIGQLGREVADRLLGCGRISLLMLTPFGAGLDEVLAAQRSTICSRCSG
jgi:hypothetical protein